MRPKALDVDPDNGTVTIGLDYREEFARAPNERSFHGGVIATLIDIAGHAAVSIKIGKMAPTIDLRIDYSRPSAGENLVASARPLQLGATLARVDVEVADTQGPPDCCWSRKLQHGTRLNNCRVYSLSQLVDGGLNDLRRYRKARDQSFAAKSVVDG